MRDLENLEKVSMGRIIGFPHKVTVQQECVDEEVLRRLEHLEPEIREDFGRFVEQISASMGEFHFEFNLAEHPHKELIESVCMQIVSGYTVQISWILKMLVDYKIEDLRRKRGL